MFPLYACEPTWKNINMWGGRRKLRWTREIVHVGARCWMEKKRRIWYYVVRRSVVWLFCVSVKQKNKVDFLSPRQERVSFEHFKKSLVDSHLSRCSTIVILFCYRLLPPIDNIFFQQCLPCLLLLPPIYGNYYRLRILPII